MGLTDLLERVDEATLAQFEKVNQWEYKKFGSSKHDLMRRSVDVAGIGGLGAGVYSTALGFESGNPLHIIFGVSEVCLSVGFHRVMKWACNKEEEYDIQTVIKTGATKAPKAESDRPTFLFLAAGTIAYGIIYTCSGTPSEEIKQTLSTGEYKSIIATTILGASCFIGGLGSYFYFRGCNMNTPKKKTVPWYKRLYTAVSGKGKEAEPVPEEVKNYSGLETAALGPVGVRF